jgi:hypothetical protein
MTSNSLTLLLAATMTVVASAATALEDRFFNSAGVNIRYIEQGSGEPIILLHGYTSRIEPFVANGVIPELAKSYRVIAFDARGHGKSGKPHDRAQYGAEMGQDVLRLMAHLNLGCAHCSSVCHKESRALPDANNRWGARPS